MNQNRRIIEFFCPRCQSIERQFWPQKPEFPKYERIQDTCLACVREMLRRQPVRHETAITTVERTIEQEAA